MNKINFELNRKFFHILGMLCPIIYMWVSKYIAVTITAMIAIFVIYVDVMRHKSKLVNDLLVGNLGHLMREKDFEKGKLTSCTWMFIGVFLTCLIFSKNVVIVSWVILFISDAAAALIGTKYGENHLTESKTIEGSLAFFITTIVCGLFFYIYFPGSYSFFGLLVASIGATLAELYSSEVGIDDNISIPLTSCILLSLF